ncbi:Uncharacterised protein [Yersinia pseudotuberculosis]|nr:Uncharacterised protein [Yersinia pseudotuberculosis]
MSAIGPNHDEIRQVSSCHPYGLNAPAAHPWRGRFTLQPILTVQDRVFGVCQQSDYLLFLAKIQIDIVLAKIQTDVGLKFSKASTSGIDGFLNIFVAVSQRHKARFKG